MPVRAVFFDLDGTLVDSNERHVDAWVSVFRDAGRAQEREAIRAQIGKGGDLLVPALLSDADDALIERLSEAHGVCFKAQYLEGIRPFAGATDLVRRVRASGRNVLLASSASRSDLDHYIALLGIADAVDGASSIDDVEASKPAPDIFQVALDKAGVAADDALAVGDTPYDVEAAGKAGVATIGLTSGPFGEAALRAAGAVAVYRDVADLLAQLETSPVMR